MSDEKKLSPRAATLIKDLRAMVDDTEDLLSSFNPVEAKCQHSSFSTCPGTLFYNVIERYFLDAYKEKYQGEIEAGTFTDEKWEQLRWEVDNAIRFMNAHLCMRSIDRSIKANLEAAGSPVEDEAFVRAIDIK